MADLQKDAKAKLPVWYNGVCDAVLAKVASWYLHYERGEVIKDQDYMTQDGQVVKMPTMYAMRIPWSSVELSHLIRIVSESDPKSPLAKEVALIPTRWKNGKLMPGNYRVVTLAFYKEHVKKMLDLLLDAKRGQTTQRIEETMQELQKQGKDLFEV